MELDWLVVREWNYRSKSVLSYAQIADWVQTNCLGNQTNIGSEN